MRSHGLGFFEQIFQIGKGLRRGVFVRTLPVTNTRLARRVVIEFACVFVVVAVQAEQFPIAAVRRVVVVIVIAVMHGELLQVFASKLTRAAAADPRVNFERLLAVAEFAALALAQGFGNHSVGVGAFSFVARHVNLLGVGVLSILR